MINKPINPTPFNTCVDMSKDWKIGCEIPNDAIDQAYVSVNKLDTGEQIYGEYKTFDTPSNKIEVEMSDSLAEYNDGEYSWNTFYYRMPDENDKAIEYEVANADENKLVLSSLNVEVILSGKRTVDNDKGIYGNCMIEQNVDYGDFHQNGGDFILTEYILKELIRKHTPSEYIEERFDEYKKYIGCPFFALESNTFEDPDKIENIYPSINGTIDSIIDLTGKGNCFVRVRDMSRHNQIVCTAKILDIYTRYVIIDRMDFHKRLRAWFSNNTNTEFSYSSYEDKGTMLIEFCRIVNSSNDITGSYIYYNNRLYYVGDGGVTEDYCTNIITTPLLKSIAPEVDEFGNVVFDDEGYILSSKQPSVGTKILIYPRDNIQVNISPDYYFRAKTPPIVGIETYNQFIEETEMIDDTTEIKNYKLSDFKAQFGVKYSSGIKFNYGCFYLSAFNPDTYNWDLIEHSPMVLDSNNLKISDIYTYNGFVNGQKYKIYGVYTDIDGDEWTTDEFEFVVDIPIISTQTKMFDIKFNTDKTTVDISINKLLDMYEEMSIEFYKLKKNDVNSYMVLQYAGGGFCKSGDIIAFNKWYDYNIQNDAYYDYYARVEYLDIEDAGAKKIDIFHVASDIHTDFKGTSILSLERVNDTHLGIVDNFNIFYHFDENKTELTNEISREYMNTFSRYPKELKGYQNSISSRFTGLLGNEINGLYIEPKGIREKWINFVNDDTVKFYRGYDGQTMIISINSSTVKPRNYAGYGIVNEVDISFKEIASTNQYAVFGTERTGD